MSKIEELIQKGKLKKAAISLDKDTYSKIAAETLIKGVGESIDIFKTCLGLYII